jgi:hypothetical protein
MGGGIQKYPPSGTPAPGFPVVVPTTPAAPPSAPTPPVGPPLPGPSAPVVQPNPVIVNNLNQQISYSNQKIGYFKMDLYNTKSNLYEESVEKWYYPPVEVKCLLERGVTSNVDTEYGVDTNQTLTVTVSKTEFETTYNFTPEVGDIITDQERYYEISSIDRTFITMPGTGGTTSTGTPGQIILYVLSAYLTRTSKLNIVKYST